jgi:hypothetical protein
MTLLKKKVWATRQTHSPNKITDESKFKPSTSGSVDSGYRRELLPDPVSYYEGQGLMFIGSHRAPWRTTECRFHGGSDCMRIKVATGAFVCMNCRASGGDVVAYHMAAHGLSFLEAAKQLGALVGSEIIQGHIRPTQFSTRDAMQVVDFEVTLLAIEGSRIANGTPVSNTEMERFRKAVARIKHIREMFA